MVYSVVYDCGMPVAEKWRLREFPRTAAAYRFPLLGGGLWAVF
jgi:hypothetical protein